MTSVLLTGVPWAPATNVDAYPRKSEQILPDMPPTGVVKVATVAVTTARTLTFDLVDGPYWAVAPLTPGQRNYQYVAFTVSTPKTSIAGPTGPPGPSGGPGPAGPQGLPGNQGPSGGIGPIGNTGAQGPRGIPGAQGAPGRDGGTGATGPQGPQGVKGDTGDPGGPVGPQGPAGPQGIKGNPGDPGPAGPTGATGPAGATGPTGAQGVKGDQGNQGVQGVPGPEGVNWRGAWSAATTYAIDDAVSLNGSSWIALIANTNVTPTQTGGTWGLLALGVRWRSAWSSGLTYAINDAVSYLGTSYVAIQNSNTNHQPDTSPTWWAPMALKGDTGATGPAGPVPDIHLFGVGTLVTLANATYTLMPIGAGPDITSALGAPDFVRNADGSVTVKTAGVYIVTASFSVNAGGAATDTLFTHTTLAVKAGNVLPTQTDAPLGSVRLNQTAYSFPTILATGIRRLAVDDRIAGYMYQGGVPGARDCALGALQIARLAA